MSVITPLPPVPLRSESDTVFADKADTFMGALPQFVNDLNNFIPIVGSSALFVNLECQSGKVHLDVLDISPSGGSTALGMNIYTNIDSFNDKFNNVIIEGFDYRAGRNIHLAICWYGWSGSNLFIQASVASAGGIAPRIYLSNVASKVVIHITPDDSDMYFFMANVRGYEPQGLHAAYSGWTINYNEALVGTTQTLLPYINKFGNVEVNGIMAVGTPGVDGMGAIQLAAGSIVGSVGDNLNITSASKYIFGWKYTDSFTAPLRYTQYSRAHSWYSAPVGSIDTSISFRLDMTIDASGNLGLGIIPSAWGSNYKAIEADTGVAFVIANKNANPMGLLSNGYIDGVGDKYSTTGAAAKYICSALYGYQWYLAPSGTAGTAITFTQVMNLDTSGNLILNTGLLLQKQPTHTSKAAVATLTIAELLTSIILTIGTTFTLTLPTGTAIDAGFVSPTTDTAFEFSVINTASGTIAMAVNTGVTSIGTLTVVAGASARFKLRRTAANTYVIYRIA